MSKYISLLALLIGAAAIQPASAVSQSMRHGAWEVICNSPADDNAKPSDTSTCSAVQRLSIEGAGAPIFAMTVMETENAPASSPKTKAGTKGSDKAFVGIISVPLGGYIAPGIEMRIDGQKPFRLLIETCNTNGCHAGFPISGQVLTQFKNGKEANVRLWVTKAKPVEIKVSLDGLSKALTEISNPSGKKQE